MPKLTLVSAPAGWGKTTLLAQWALGAGQDERFGWLSLDSADSDPVWFWMYVVAALQKVSPAVGTRAVELLAMGADPVQVVLPTLLNDLDTITDPVVLIFDDYHLVVSAAVHEQLAFLIGRMPANLRLVLATRSDPMLPLARLRASGELGELRSDDLRFGVVEADHLLNEVLALDLTDDDVHLLHRRTEGWVAGLYLAALSLAGRPDASGFIRSFAGDNRHIVDYLMAEVLEGQPPHMRRFLLYTSVLGRLSGALCDAMLQTSGSASVLDRIERENLFVVPLDLSRHWYRYHQLFAELLRAELQHSEPDVVADLHRRAAAWFQTQGLVDEAVRHLIAAGEIARSADLIAADWVNEFNSGGLSTISGWLDLLPEESVRQDPRLSAARAWIALTCQPFDDAAEWIEAVETGSAAGTSSMAASAVNWSSCVRSTRSRWVTSPPRSRRRATRSPSTSTRHPWADRRLLHLWSRPVLLGQHPRGPSRLPAGRSAGPEDRRSAPPHLRAGLSRFDRSRVWSTRRRRTPTPPGYRRCPDRADGEHFVKVMVSLAAATILDARGDAAAADTAHLAVSFARNGAGILEVAKALLVRGKIVRDLGDHGRRRRAGMRPAGCFETVRMPM